MATLKHFGISFSLFDRLYIYVTLNRLPTRTYQEFWRVHFSCVSLSKCRIIHDFIQCENDGIFQVYNKCFENLDV